MKAWLFDDMFQFDRSPIRIDGLQGEWGAGDSVAEEEELPSPPQNVHAKPGNGRIVVTWDPVPDAMYYNLYFQTSKGVQIKFSELTRPIAGPEDFKGVIGVKKEKATCLEGRGPYVHDLANGTCTTMSSPSCLRAKALNRKVMAFHRHLWPWSSAVKEWAMGVELAHGDCARQERQHYVAARITIRPKFDKTGTFRLGGR